MYARRDSPVEYRRLTSPVRSDVLDSAATSSLTSGRLFARCVPMSVWYCLAVSVNLTTDLANMAVADVPGNTLSRGVIRSSVMATCMRFAHFLSDGHCHLMYLISLGARFMLRWLTAAVSMTILWSAMSWL
jgi:hypothetical protein